MKNLQDLIPDYAKDLRINLGGLERTESLSETQLYGTILAVAIATRSPRIVAAAEALAAERLDAANAEAARTASALMGMNNIYFRFLHLSSNEAYGRLPPRLRMQGLANHGANGLDFELWCLAVSAVNGCGMCVDSHERKLRTEGASEAQIQDAVRVAAILHGAAAVIEARAVPPLTESAGSAA
ncbi:MAG: carboxymuconolactone decarboxylase family protein [Planctomycetota bacterium]